MMREVSIAAREERAFDGISWCSFPFEGGGGVELFRTVVDADVKKVCLPSFFGLVI